MRIARWAMVVATVLLAGMPMRAQTTQTAPPAQTAQPAPKIDYDTFMQLDLDERIRQFNLISAENRAELVQTQIKRWVEQNRSRLSAAQLKMMEENIAFVTAERYNRSMSEQDRAKAQDLEKRTAALFTREEMSQALSIHGPYIKK